ncbi:MAG: hypothetical protein E6Q34_07795, partial [Burkholderiaceae bacterium]
AVALVLAAVIGLPMVFESEPKSSAPNISIEIPSKDADGSLQVKEVARAPQPTASSASQATAQSIDKSEEIIAPPTSNVSIASASKADVKALPETAVAKVESTKTNSNVTEKRPEVLAQNVVANTEAKNTPNKAEPPKKPEVKVEAKTEAKTDPKPINKNESKPEVKKDNKDEAARALALLEGRSDSSTKDTKSPEKVAAKTAGSFSVQVAAMSSQAKIKELQGKLKAADIQTYTQKITTDNGEVVRVRVGPFANKAEAEKMQKKLAKLGMNGSLIPH